MNFDRILSRAFLLFIATVLSLVLIEIGFRTYTEFQPVDQYQTNDTAHVPRPYVMAVAEPELDVINSLGYKGELPSPRKKGKEKRIFILGGSVVYGLDPMRDPLPDEEFENKQTVTQALPGLIENRLQKKFGKHVKVYNFGISSTVVTQELVRLVVDVINFEPDIVISYSGGNDFLHSSHPGQPHRFVFYEVNPLWVTDIADYPLFHLLAFGSQTLRFFLKGYFEKYFLSQARKTPFFAASEPDFYNNRIFNYVSSMEKMHKISKAFGAQFVGILHPLKYASFESGIEKKIFQNWGKRINKELNSDKRSKIHFWDLSHSLNDQPLSIWEDMIHLHLSGNERMADIISERIIETFSDELLIPSH